MGVQGVRGQETRVSFDVRRVLLRELVFAWVHRCTRAPPKVRMVKYVQSLGPAEAHNLLFLVHRSLVGQMSGLATQHGHAFRCPQGCPRCTRLRRLCKRLSKVERTVRAVGFAGFGAQNFFLEQ